MKTGYCWFCDSEARVDPCPGCGKPLYRPAQGGAPSQDPRGPLTAMPELDRPRHPNLRTLILLLAVVLLLLVIAFVAASSEGIS